MQQSRFTALLALAACLLASQASADGWKAGRATYYGLDGWSIHKGSCGFGYQWPDIYPGFDVAAIADASPEFAGSCGRCYEVRCRAGSFSDGYGQYIDRSSGCKDPSKTVVVKAVDNCPCNYPGNPYSNKRWCCGDNGLTHFDLSVWAFEKLAASNSLGAIGVEFRQVACDYQSSNPAPALANPSPPEQPWSGAKRPEDMTLVRRFDAVGGPQDAVSQIDSPSQANGQPIVPIDTMFQGANVDNVLSGKTYSSASSSSSSSEQSCYDTAPTDGSTCQYRKDSGNCEESWMKNGKFCDKTCGRCTDTSKTNSSSASTSSTSSCFDTAPTDGSTCQYRKDSGNCEESWMKNGKFCDKTCGRCSDSSSSKSSSDTSSTSGCYDKAPTDGSTCQYRKDSGNCWESWMKDGKFCDATCGRCTVQSFDGPSGRKLL